MADVADVLLSTFSEVMEVFPKLYCEQEQKSQPEVFKVSKPSLLDVELDGVYFA